MASAKTPNDPPAMRRTVGVPGAVLMGLGSILGTGLFVSIGVTAGVAGAYLVPAVALAAAVATFNGLSSAQLAAAYPVSGGTYEYANRTLGSYPGFVAGWMFLLAKSASAATAALGFGGYLLALAGREAQGWEVRLLGLALVAILTSLVAGGIRRSNLFNIAVVSFTLLVLGGLVLFGLPLLFAPGEAGEALALPSGGQGLLHGTALMFVAYTGYGRIATLGEEIRDPSRSIPKAIVMTLLVTMVLYVAVAAVALVTMGAEGLADATRATAAPLEAVANALSFPSWLVGVAAVTAMVGVSLNLLLGLSRVMLAMARRRDLPKGLGALDEGGSPRAAVFTTGALIFLLVLIGDVRATWSFSAFTVLIYYALTNLAALRLPAAARRFPRWVAILGLGSCVGLAFWVDPLIWMVGLAAIAAGLLWHTVARRMARANARAR